MTRATSTVARPSPAGRPRRLVRGVAAVAVTALAVLGTAIAASADGPTTFSNTAAIAIPATGSANQIGPASPYPSTITVSGMTGAVTDVTVTWTGFSHNTVGDVDALLVAPTGANLVLLSDLGDQSLRTASNVNLTFSDAGSVFPDVVTVASGTYIPTNQGAAVDSWPTPAPAASSQTTLGGAFAGIDPNGTWSLYIVDDATGDVGSIAGGWSLTVTTTTASVATTTAVTTSLTPAATGAAVTFTATVTAGGSPVTAGSVQFRDGSTALGTPVTLNGSGQASLTTSALAEGTHTIRAEYGGATGFLASNGSVSQRVDNTTVVTGDTYCNTGVITVPNVGTAGPYPSNITVSGRTGTVTGATVTLKGVSHTAPIDFDILLSSPTPTTNLVLLSDSGGQNPVSGVDVTFDDAAASAVPNPLVSGTFRPTDDDTSGTDAFPAPAPGVSSATALSVFDGISPNGTWSLWVVDDATGDSGSISGGWCLTLRTPAATTTTLTSSLNPSVVGDSVTFTATVDAGGAPVSAGNLVFSIDGGDLGPVAVDPTTGQATLTLSSLSAGTHTIDAEYAGTSAFAASDGSLSQVVETAPTTTTLTSSLNPSVVGDAVTFTATVVVGSAPATSGTVSFSIDGTAQAPVAIDASGQATLTTSALTAGTHTISAAYSGTAALAASDDYLSQVVQPPPTPPTADAGGPYAVAEGDALTLDGSATPIGATFGWDLDGDGTYTDAVGATPTLTWDQLESFGIDDGPSSHTIGLRVTAGGQTADATATVSVANTAPVTTITGSLTAVAGTPFTVKIGADDPSSADMAAMFTYTVDWGDGSPVETVTGPADPPVTHTYAAAGTYAATLTATDKDGGVGDPNVVTVTASPALAPTGGGPALGLLWLVAALLAAGSALAFRRVRRRAPR